MVRFKVAGSGELLDSDEPDAGATLSVHMTVTMRGGARADLRCVVRLAADTPASYQLLALAADGGLAELSTREGIAIYAPLPKRPREYGC